MTRNGTARHPDQDGELLSGRANWIFVPGKISEPRVFEIFAGIRRLKMVSKTRSTNGNGINTDSPAQVASAKIAHSNFGFRISDFRFATRPP